MLDCSECDYVMLSLAEDSPWSISILKSSSFSLVSDSSSELEDYWLEVSSSESEDY